MFNCFVRLILILLLVWWLPACAHGGWSVDFETGLAFSGYNDVRIPGSTGTNISLSEELSSDPTTFGRIRVSYDWGQRHHLSALIAPLRLESEGQLDRVVTFVSEEFPADSLLWARYRFDSYRVTYRYSLHRSDKLTLGLGLTAKIRDAAIRLSGGGLIAQKTNTGFVPLLNLSFRWQFARKLSLLIEGDGLAAPQGRAEDFLVALRSNTSDRFHFKIGYRLLEGGVDNDEVYNFTLVNYLFVGTTWVF